MVLVDCDRHGDGYVTLIVVNANNSGCYIAVTVNGTVNKYDLTALFTKPPAP